MERHGSVGKYGYKFFTIANDIINMEMEISNIWPDCDRFKRETPVVYRISLTQWFKYYIVISKVAYACVMKST